MVVMSQQVRILKVMVTGASPYLGEMRLADGSTVSAYSSDPDRVMCWLCDGWRGRFNQYRSRRMKYAKDGETLVPLGDRVDDCTDAQARIEYSWLAAIPQLVLQAPGRIENTEWWGAVKRRKTNIKHHRKAGAMPRFKRKSRGMMFTCWNNGGRNANLTVFNRTHGEVIITGMNPKEHRGHGARFQIHIRVKLSEPIRTYTSVGVDWAGKTLTFINAPLPVERTMTGAMTGIDRGVAHTLALSDGEFIDLPKGRLERIDREIRRRQKAQARRIRESGKSAKEYVRQPSKRYVAERERIHALYGKTHRIIDDWQHKVTTQLVRDYDVIAVEALNVADMTRKAKPKTDPDKHNHYLPNGQSRKRGLNRSMRSMALSGLAEKLAYKASLAGNLYVEVNPAYTSQQCNRCGHTAAENRESQAVFTCAKCGHANNADTNAARNILAKAFRGGDTANTQAHDIRRQARAYEPAASVTPASTRHGE